MPKKKRHNWYFRPFPPGKSVKKRVFSVFLGGTSKKGFFKKGVFLDRSRGKRPIWQKTSLRGVFAFFSEIREKRPRFWSGNFLGAEIFETSEKWSFFQKKVCTFWNAFFAYFANLDVKNSGPIFWRFLGFWC